MIMCISGIYALKEEIESSEMTISTGNVEIELKEYDGNNQPFAGDGMVIMPGDKIDLIPRVNNLDSECYLRAKITYKINGTKIDEASYINGNYKSWNKKDGYYYLNNSLSSNGSVDVFNEVIVPSNLSNSNKGKSVEISVRIDAIQAKNFNGDWTNIEILESINRSYDIGSGSSVVVYETDSDSSIDVSEEFFEQFENLLPGDNISGNIKITNSSNNKNSYYLKIENDLDDEERSLLDKIKLVIKDSNGDIIQNTNLANEDSMKIGTIDAKGVENYTIEVSIPKEANNEVSKLLVKLKWIFSSEFDDEVIVNPQTGDMIGISITIFVVSSIGLLIMLLLWNKENKKEKRNERKE